MQRDVLAPSCCSTSLDSVVPKPIGHIQQPFHVPSTQLSVHDCERASPVVTTGGYGNTEWGVFHACQKYGFLPRGRGFGRILGCHTIWSKLVKKYTRTYVCTQLVRCGSPRYFRGCQKHLSTHLSEAVGVCESLTRRVIATPDGVCEVYIWRPCFSHLHIYIYIYTVVTASKCSL